MKKLFKMAQKFVNAIEAKGEEIAKGVSALYWVANLPIDADEEGIFFRSSSEKGAVIPAEEGVAIATSIQKAQEALDDAQSNAAKKLKLDNWAELEQKYKAAKLEQMKLGNYGLPMEEIKYGKELMEVRNKAIKQDAGYARATKWYWGMCPMKKNIFFEHINSLGDVVKGLPDFFSTPVLAKTHPFYESYWEMMRILLPSWVSRTLIRDGNARLPIEQKVNRSNGVWDSNAMRGRSADDEEFEKDEQNQLFVLMAAKIRGLIDFEEVQNCDNNPIALLKMIKTFVESKDVKPYAIAYRLIELVNSGWLYDGQVQEACCFTEREWLRFKNQHIADIAVNAQQSKDKVIDQFVGEWYTLSFEANLDDEDQLAMLKETMINNLVHPEIYGRMLKRKTNKKDLWDKYRRLDKKEIKEFLDKETLFKRSSLYQDMREKAGNNLQNNTFALRKLCETNKLEMQFKTDDPEWDSFLLDVRKEALKNIAALVDTIVKNRTLPGADNDDSITDLAMTRAAYNIFNETSEKIVAGFGLLEE